MTYKLVAFVLAEAGVFDMRGNLSIIGVMPTRMAVPEIPGNLNPTICAVLEQEEFEPWAIGRAVQVTAEVRDPSGNVAFFSRGESPIATGPVLDGELHRVQIVLTSAIRAMEAGIYLFSMQFMLPSSNGSFQELRATQRIEVVDGATALTLSQAVPRS